MTTIKEFIERGAYPKDDKGRALVSMRNGDTATIAATDFGAVCFPIIGWPAARNIMQQWQAGGRHGLCGESELDLLPPPPRKVKVKAWVAYPVCGGRIDLTFPQAAYSTREEAERVYTAPNYAVVAMSGEHEEPWS